jgi:hypothetical protein
MHSGEPGCSPSALLMRLSRVRSPPGSPLFSAFCLISLICLAPVRVQSGHLWPVNTLPFWSPKNGYAATDDVVAITHRSRFMTADLQGILLAVTGLNHVSDCCGPEIMKIVSSIPAASHAVFQLFSKSKTGLPSLWINSGHLPSPDAIASSISAAISP